MPLNIFKTQASKTIKKYRDMMGKYDLIDVIEPVIDDLAIFFGVSRLAAKSRMVDAGYEETRGAFIYLDGKYVTPHRYKKDSITGRPDFLYRCRRRRNSICYESGTEETGGDRCISVC